MLRGICAWVLPAKDLMPPRQGAVLIQLDVNNVPSGFDVEF